MNNVRIAMIAAVGRNGAIGVGGKLVWRLPSDFAFYKATTMGKPLVMGRKTFESIGRPLPGRTNIVVTRNTGYKPEGVEVFASLDAAIDRAKAIATADGKDEIFINGGGDIYRQAIERAERLYITHVDAEAEGDSFFPKIDPDRWVVVEQPEVQRSEKDEADYRIAVYERR